MSDPYLDLIGEQGVSDDDALPSNKPKVIGQSSSAFSNMKNNFNTTLGDYSKGNILGGLAGTYALAHNPTGNYGASSDSQKTLSPLDTNHYNAQADENGLHAINPDGVAFMQQGMQSKNAMDTPQVGIPQLPSTGNSGSGNGEAGQTAQNAGISSLISTLMVAA